MSRTRISTGDGDLLIAVRERRPRASDSSVLEEALETVGRRRCARAAARGPGPDRMRSICTALGVAVDCR